MLLTTTSNLLVYNNCSLAREAGSPHFGWRCAGHFCPSVQGSLIPLQLAGDWNNCYKVVSDGFTCPSGHWCWLLLSGRVSLMSAATCRLAWVFSHSRRLVSSKRGQAPKHMVLLSLCSIMFANVLLPRASYGSHLETRMNRAHKSMDPRRCVWFTGCQDCHSPPQ